MGIVTLERLNDLMGSPEWTVPQRKAIQDVLDGLESTLESALHGAWITPRPVTEVAPVLLSGLVATKRPVHTLSGIDGVVVDADHPLAAPWTLSGHRLRLMAGATPPAQSFGTPAFPVWGDVRARGARSLGQVTVEYEGGWGGEPALVLAIQSKARNWVRNWVDSAVHIHDADAEQPPPLAERWTPSELAALGIYRNLTAVRR